MAYYSKDSQGNPRKGRNLDELLEKIQSSKIENGTITIGDDSITPITEHQDMSGKANVGDSYTKQESDAKYPTRQDIPSSLSDLSEDATHRVVTDTEKSTWNGKYSKPSGGIPKSDLDSSVQSSLGKADQAETDIADIEGKIPTQATSSNQLADKDFVNSSISTATATYRGAYNLVSDLSLTTSATHAQIATALDTAINTKDNNDYCFVQIPTADATPTIIERVERYKYNGTSWEFEYTLNNSGYTAAQWEAINSAITSGLVTKLSALPTNAELTTLFNGKLAADTLYAGAAVQGGAANKAVSIPFGQVDSTSTSTAFTATVDGVTELRDGVCVYLKNGVVTSAEGWTLNINNLGAKPVYGTMAAATRSTTVFSTNYTMLFVYNENRVSGGCWDIFYGYYADANTIGYDIREYYSGYKKTKTNVERYQIMLSCFDGTLLPVYSGAYSTGTTKALTTLSFNPLGQVYYFWYTTSYSADAYLPASYLFTQATYTTADLRYSFNTGSTLVQGNDVYLVCVPQPDGSAVLHSNPIAFSLPTTEDGLLYKRIGKCYNTTNIILEQHKPVYYYKDGGIREWTGNTIPTELTDYSFTKKSVTQNGKTEIKQVGGDTVVWNQMLDHERGSGSVSGITYTNNNNGSFTITADGTKTSVFSYQTNNNSISFVNGHKYLLKGCPSGGSLQTYNLRYNSNGYGDIGNGVITLYDGTATSEKITINPIIIIQANVAGSFTFRPQLIDLTLMFGAGNEPSTVEEFEDWLKDHVGESDYYAYNTGELLSVKAQGIQNGTDTHNLDITTLTGKLNGEGNSVTIFPDGLKSVGTVADEIKVDNGVVKAVKRIGSVDLGTLNWSYFSNYDIFIVTSASVLNGTKTKCISSKYAEGSYTESSSDKVVRLENNGAVRVKDTQYGTNATTFKSAMQGVLLYYELATPEEYVLDDQSYLPLAYTEEKGSETILLPVNGNTPTHIAPRMDVRVSGEEEWVEDKINALPKDYISSDSLQSMLNAMQTAGIITSYTMTYNTATGKYEFSFT